MRQKKFDIDYHYFLDTILSITGYRADIKYESDSESNTCIITFYEGKSTDKKVVCKQKMLIDKFNDSGDILERTLLYTLKTCLTDFIKNNIK